MQRFWYEEPLCSSDHFRFQFKNVYKFVYVTLIKNLSELCVFVVGDGDWDDDAVVDDGDWDGDAVVGDGDWDGDAVVDDGDWDDDAVVDDGDWDDDVVVGDGDWDDDAVAYRSAMTNYHGLQINKSLFFIWDLFSEGCCFYFYMKVKDSFCQYCLYVELLTR